MFSDNQGELTLTDVLTSENHERFKKIPSGLNRSYTEKTSWIHFQVKTSPDHKEQIYILITNPVMNELTVYIQQGKDPFSAASYEKSELGDHTPISERETPHPLMVTRLDSSLALINVYVRIHTNSVHTFEGSIISNEKLIADTAKYTFTHVAIMMIIFSLFVINAFSAIRMRDLSYGYYAAYLLLMALNRLTIQGFGFIVIPEWYHVLSDILVGVATILAYTMFALFAVKLFRTRSKFPLIHKYFLILASVGIAGSFTVTTCYYSYFARFLWLNGPVFILLLLGMAIVLTIRKAPEGKLFIMAF